MEDAIAGAMAGVLAAFVVHPIDTVKTCKMSGLWTGPTGLSASIVHIARHEGSRSLYRGFGAVALFATPANGLYFGVYEAGSRWLEHQGMQGSAIPLTAATIANLAALVIWVPQDVIKERQQVLQVSGDDSYRTILKAARTVIHEGGWWGLYRGFSTSAAMYTPLCVLYWLLYEDFKVRAVTWASKENTNELTVPWHFLGGLYPGLPKRALR